jgi:hypothetical protein
VSPHEWALLVIGIILGHILTWAVMLAFGGDAMDAPAQSPADQEGQPR